MTADEQTEFGPTAQIELVAPGDVFTDERVQRALRSAQVNKIVARYDEDAIGIPILSHRTDSRLHTIDGQTRIAALISLGHGQVPIEMLVHTGLSLKREAELFLLHNERNNVSAVDHFRIGVKAELPECLQIERILAHHGLRVTGGAGEGVTNCITAIQDVYRSAGNAGGSVLDNTLRVIVGAWGPTKSVIQPTVLGVGQLLSIYDGRVELDRLTTKLQQLRSGPNGVAQGAATRRDSRLAANTKVATMMMVRDQYNDGLRKAAERLGD